MVSTDKTMPGSQDGGKPFVIVAFLGHQTLGDFLMYNLVAASIARRIPNSKLAIAYRDDRPYKNLLARCNSYAARSLVIPADSDQVIPMDFFDGREVKGGRGLDEDWYREEFHRPDLFLVPSMIDIYACQDPVPCLEIPRDMEDQMRRALVLRGADPEKWIACLHMREPTYRFRWSPVHGRNVHPETYIPVVEHIIREQGGQVIRLGDPSMMEFPEMEGFIDLSRDEDSFAEQLFAVSRARYYFGTDSGPAQIACAFKTPVAMTNALVLGIWNEGDVFLTKHHFTPGGRELTFAELYEMGSLTAHLTHPPSTVIVDNSTEELIEVADYMFRATEGCEAWREEKAVLPESELGSLDFPLPRKDHAHRGRIFVWPG